MKRIPPPASEGSFSDFDFDVDVALGGAAGAAGRTGRLRH